METQLYKVTWWYSSTFVLFGKHATFNKMIDFFNYEVEKKGRQRKQGMTDFILHHFCWNYNHLDQQDVEIL